MPVSHFRILRREHQVLALNQLHPMIADFDIRAAAYLQPAGAGFTANERELWPERATTARAQDLWRRSGFLSGVLVRYGIQRRIWLLNCE